MLAVMITLAWRPAVREIAFARKNISLKLCFFVSADRMTKNNNKEIRFNIH